jgi:SpoVK/Ycf46/Vps4 family AAA+-type ATPase
VHVVAVASLAPGERSEAWVAHLPADAHAHAAAVAARFPLSREQIADACRLAAAQAREERLAAPARRHLVTAGQAVAGTAMGGLARRLEAGWDWDDLVLPAEDIATLRSIAAYLRHRETVLDGWGFGGLGSGDGLTVMFCGQSGTGKTMAAQVIANDLGLEAFHVDVSAIVSKYIGETEKNLERLFAAATDAGALMVFDEADALFGKRSAVTDARDRYANLEVSYLLQRIESHPGASILTTNMRQNVDQAFLRRMDFIVDFPLPGEAERLAIWRRHLPAGAPVGDDLDLHTLAREHELPGGAIRNCLRAAAFAAADDGGAIGMAHVRAAIRLELRKLGRLSTRGAAEGRPTA